MTHTAHRVLSLGAAALTATTLTAQWPPPAPDMILGDGSVDGIQRLVDLDGDGVYDGTTGEAYDYYITTGMDSSFRTIAYLNGYYYTIGPVTSVVDKLYKFQDTNGDGLIQPSEFTIAMDPGIELVGSGTGWQDVVADANNSLYISNRTGANEGIWKLTDMDGDGNFQTMNGMGQVEIWPAAVESGTTVPPGAPLGVASIAVGNTNAGGVFASMADLQSMSFIPYETAGPSAAGGRLIVEVENNAMDSFASFEDINNDGDFYDAGEVNLWIGLSPTRLPVDVTPAMGQWDPSYQDDYYEMEHVVYHKFTDPMTMMDRTVYYLPSERSDNTEEHGIVFKCEDLNGDGDVNDLNECVVWFDGSLDPVPALQSVNDYDAITGVVMDQATGDPIVCIQYEPTGTNTHEHFLRLRDRDGSGAIDSASEVHIMHIKDNTAPYNPLIVGYGTVPALPGLPSGVPGYYRRIDQNTCFSSAGTRHTFQIGTDNWNDKLVLGAAPVTFQSYGSVGLMANSPIDGLSALHIGVEFPGGPFALDGPVVSCQLPVLPLVTVGFSADTQGVITFNVPISAGAITLPALRWQWVTADLGINAYNVTASQTFEVKFGDYFYSTRPTQN